MSASCCHTKQRHDFERGLCRGLQLNGPLRYDYTVQDAGRAGCKFADSSDVRDDDACHVCAHHEEFLCHVVRIADN